MYVFTFKMGNSSHLTEIILVIRLDSFKFAQFLVYDQHERKALSESKFLYSAEVVAFALSPHLRMLLSPSTMIAFNKDPRCTRPRL